MKYRGIIATRKHVQDINTIIASNPDMSRYALSKELCRIWKWIQPNGALRDMVCRGFLLRLEEAGYITLPARKRDSFHHCVHRKKPVKIEIDQMPVSGTLATITPPHIKQVRRTPWEKLYNSLIEHYHYLGYCHPVGENLKYIIFTDNRPIACMGWTSAPRHIRCRDTFIGWNMETRKKNLHFIAYNMRFLILPWISIPCLGSYLLAKMARTLPTDWQCVYNHALYFLETFVDTERYKGTCYKAANWIELGTTTGRGKNDQTHKPNRSIKAVWGYPLVKNFREKLCQRNP